MNHVRVKWIVTLSGGERIEIRASTQREACRLVRDHAKGAKIIGCRRA